MKGLKKTKEGRGGLVFGGTGRGKSRYAVRSAVRRGGGEGRRIRYIRDDRGWGSFEGRGESGRSGMGQSSAELQTFAEGPKKTVRVNGGPKEGEEKGPEGGEAE